MSPPGGLTTLEDHDMTWSALNSTRAPSSAAIAKQRWSAAWPGVCSAVSPATASPSRSFKSGEKRAARFRRNPPWARRSPAQRRHRADMVGMRVAEQDARHAPARGAQDRLHVLRPVRARDPARALPAARSGRCSCRGRSSARGSGRRSARMPGSTGSAAPRSGSGSVRNGILPLRPARPSLPCRPRPRGPASRGEAPPSRS